jgi:ElaB/YqjD/DUF883 family membrane-anchored ribosome-binding protein
MSVTDFDDTGRTDTPRADGNGLAEAPAKAARLKQTLQDGARRGAEAARAQTAAVGQKVSQMTQERPITSVSTALGVGLAAGLVLGFCLGQAMRD